MTKLNFASDFMNLVIVESPAKSKTITKFLGEGYKVAATMGHIMDLPKSKLGVDVENKYSVDYDVIKGKEKTIRELKKLVKQADKDIFLALDPDREGEAIAANVVEALKLKKPKRIVFHEITKDAVVDAINNPRTINEDLVDAQKARRVLDRLVGYKLSELLWKKIWYGLSAGRVQSVATRLIVERERERLGFKPEEYWDIFANLEAQKTKKFRAKLAQKNGKKFVPSSKKESDEVEEDTKKAKWTVADVTVKKTSRHAFPPYTTSTLQQAANNYLGYGASRTMQLAQQLYQGVNVKGKGHVGLISYMRTDSTNLSEQAIKAIRGMVKGQFGDKYLPDTPNYYKTRSRLAQEAHEAIRPTDFSLPPSAVKDSLSPQQLKLYEMIWNRAVGSQMSPMEYNVLELSIDADCSGDKKYTFKVRGYELLFDGFAKVVGSAILREDGIAEDLAGVTKGESLDFRGLECIQNFTKPRARYTEATLIKALESHGIGRPSTYATIISTIQTRGYVAKEARYLFPTDVGFVVTDFLIKHFEQIVDYDFTASIEEDLDEVAEGKTKWVPVVDKVYVPFAKDLKKKGKEVKKEDVVILGPSKIKCPTCKGKMVERLGRNGKFLSCAKFPDCKGMLGIDGKAMDDVDLKKYLKPEKCEKCGGKMLLKSGRFGKFLACENYPECKSTSPLLLRENCPECGKPLVEKKGKWGKMFTGCSGYPDCKYIKKAPKKGQEVLAEEKKE